VNNRQWCQQKITEKCRVTVRMSVEKFNAL
jgi:hypothetical protein